MSLGAIGERTVVLTLRVRRTITQSVMPTVVWLTPIDGSYFSPLFSTHLSVLAAAAAVTKSLGLA
jgi:hypothetical protein